MEYSVDKTTRKDRIKLVKKALAISISGADVPTDETLNLAKDYVDGKIELEELQKRIIDKYNKINKENSYERPIYTGKWNAKK